MACKSLPALPAHASLGTYEVWTCLLELPWSDLEQLAFPYFYFLPDHLPVPSNLEALEAGLRGSLHRLESAPSRL